MGKDTVKTTLLQPDLDFLIRICPFDIKDVLT